MLSSFKFDYNPFQIKKWELLNIGLSQTITYPRNINDIVVGFMQRIGVQFETSGVRKAVI